MSHTKHQYPRLLLASVVLFLLATAPPAAGESRWFLNGKVGSASLDRQFGTRSPTSFEGSDETGSVEVGYVLNRYLAVQGGYHDLGSYGGLGSPCPEDAEVCPLYLEPSLPFAAVPMTADVSGLSLTLVPRWPVYQHFSLYGKVGVIDWDTEVTGLGFGHINSYSDRDLLTGVGAQYDFRKGLGVLVEYQRMRLDHGSASVGASWRF